MSRSSLRPRWVLLVGTFLAAVGFGLLVVRPFGSASIGRDAAAPVIHFERIAAGHRLETYLGITPKPLITLINGAVYAVTGDWRPVAWLEIAAYALCVVLGAVLAGRVAGRASAAFVATAFLISPVLLEEIAFVHAVPWALLSVLIAGFAVTADRPRYGLAGLALMAGTLARLETFLVVLLALAALALLEVLARAYRRPRPPGAAYLVLLGFLAFPMMAVHDQLLTGDPLFWAKVAQINSDIAGTAQGPLWVSGWLIRHLLELAPLLPLAVLGAGVLVRRRCWSLIVGLLALGPGTAAFLVVMATRGVFFSTRYVAPIDLSLIFVAGVGLVAIDVPALRRWVDTRVRGPERLAAVAFGLGIVTGLAFAPNGLLDATVRQTIANEATLMRDEQRAIAVIRPALTSTPRWWEGASPIAGAPAKVLVPARVREQAVVDLDLGLDQVVRTRPELIDPAAGHLVPGQIVYHDRHDDGPDKRYAALEIDRPTVVGGLRLVPLLADRAGGIWVVSVESLSGP